MKDKLAIVILAAGKGTRMKSDIPKVLHKIAGKPMINWLIDRCECLNPDKIIVVIGPDMDDLAAAVSPHETAIQEKQAGTGDAVKAALPALKDFDGKVLVLLGDEPFLSKEVLQELCAHDLSVMGIEVDNPKGLGRLVLNADDTLKEITEEKDCTEAQRDITLCNAGNFCIPSSHLETWLSQLSNDNAAGEFYLTDIPAIAAKDGIKTQIVRMAWDGAWGINNKIQLAEHEAKLQDILRAEHMINGVQMLDPFSVHFNHDTEIGAGSLIEPNVFFGKNVRIEKDVHIKAFSHIEGAHIKAGCSIGPFARIRPGSEIGEGSKIGNFIEINRSTLGKGTKAGHHSYIGDATLGENVNYSAGAITANYDGQNKHKTVIGDNVMIGTNVNLIAPVTIEKNAFIAAGSTITKDVSAGSLAVGRAKEKTIPGWTGKKK